MQKNARVSTANPLSGELFAFVRDLREHNDRDWFRANKSRYEAAVQEPALELIARMGPWLDAISPHFVADPRTVGGSLFRIYRDTRFSKDKTPYKTHVGIHFRHERAKTAHAPGFYLHLEPDASFVGAGIWRPDREPLGRIRAAIAERPDAWSTAVRDVASHRFRLEGDALKRAPAGFDASHPLIDELRRKDFVVIAPLTERTAISRRFPEVLAERFGAAAPVVRFLCEATEAPF